VKVGEPKKEKSNLGAKKPQSFKNVRNKECDDRGSEKMIAG